MSALMTPTFCLTRREARPIARRRDMMTNTATGMSTQTTSASRHSIVNMTMSAPVIVTMAMNRSSGP